MKRTWTMLALLVVLAVSAYDFPGGTAHAAEHRQFIGNWIGTWEGEGSGKFELSFAAAVGDALEGRITVGTSVGDYTTTFATLSFTGSKMTGRYAYPLDTHGEIVIDGDFDAAKASGTWKLVEKGGDDAAFEGTWHVIKD